MGRGGFNPRGNLGFFNLPVGVFCPFTLIKSVGFKKECAPLYIWDTALKREYSKIKKKSLSLSYRLARWS